MIDAKFSLVGEERLLKALKDPEFIKGPLKDFLERASSHVALDAKQRAPVNTGRLRDSIAHRVETYRAFVGSNLTYARPVEFGSRPHFPPLSAMQPWARRHGFPAGNKGAFLVARAIAQRGTKAKPFLIPALRENERVIMRYLDQAIRSIEAKWGQNG